MKMKRFLIEEAKCGFIRSGPLNEGIVVSSVKYECNGKSQWLNLFEYDGVPMFYLTGEDYYDKLLDLDMSQEFAQYIEENFQIYDFEGLDLTDYDSLLDSIACDMNNPAVPFIRFILLLTRCPEEDVEGLIGSSVGKYADELSLPLSDLEEDFIAENEEYEEDEECEEFEDDEEI